MKSATSLGHEISCERDIQPYSQFYTEEDVFSIYLMTSKTLDLRGSISVFEGLQSVALLGLREALTDL
jgi:hypothetical protein